MSKYIRDRFKGFDAYAPGEQPQDKTYIKLNTNESPYPPGPKVLQAVSKEDLKELRLYPSPTQDKLKSALAKKLNELYLSESESELKPGLNSDSELVLGLNSDSELALDLNTDSEFKLGLNKDNIFVSNGSDDILNFSFMAFSGGDIPAVYPDISYGFYSVYADFQGVKSEVIPLDEEYRIKPADYIPIDKELFESQTSDQNQDNSQSTNHKQRFIVIANPNAPTGIALTLEEIESIVSGNPNSVVLIDEAYIDFGGETAIPLIPKYDNLIVCRTYSKSASLAGARLGFAVASKQLIEDLELIKFSTNPYNINRMTERVGLAVLEEYDYYMDNCKSIIETREWTKTELSRLGFKVLESKANFLFVGTGSEPTKSDDLAISKDEDSESGNCRKIAYESDKRRDLATEPSGEELYIKLKENGILVRWFNKDRIRDYVRITIGTKNDMEKLIETIKEINNGKENSKGRESNKGNED